MSCILSKIAIFTVGAAIGSAVTWKFLKSKYERIANEEIKSMREYVRGKVKEQSEPATDELEAEEEENREEYASILKDNNYTDEEVEFMEKPYVISPDEFGENGDEYETISLTYYADGVLADDMDEVIDDVDDVVGKDALTHFGEYEDDSVFVRNERMRCDYEILLDSRKYSDVKKLYNPRRVEG